MIKYFCDSCGAEVTDDNEVTGGKMKSGRLGASVLIREGGANERRQEEAVD